jgi:hypothetical protein
MSDVSIFKLAGVMKNDVLDCWEFTNEEDARGNVTDEATEADELQKIMDESPKANHKRKKRAKKNSKNKEIDVYKADRKVRWGHVQEFLFSRGLSWTSVPSNGAYPLGLEDYQGQHSYSLDLPYCAPTSRPKSVMVQIKGGKKKRSIANVDNGNEEGVATSNDASQFGSLNEKDRLAILKGESGSSSHNHNKDATSEKNYLNEVNREIKKIRDSRAHIGCDCKPIKVEKLNVTKLKAEITQRKSVLRKIVASSASADGEVDNINLDKMKKAELMKTLKEILKECQLCVSNNCECFRAGIPCSTLACGCIRNTSVNATAGSHLSEVPADSSLSPAESDFAVSDHSILETGETSPTSITHDDHPRHDSLGEKDGENCENPFGKDLFDFNSVDCYRKAIIEKFHATSQVSSY